MLAYVEASLLIFDAHLLLLLWAIYSFLLEKYYLVYFEEKESVADAAGNQVVERYMTVGDTVKVKYRGKRVYLAKV